MANYTHSTTSVQVKPAAGKLFNIFVGSATAGTLAVYDSSNSSTSDPVIIGAFPAVGGASYATTTVGMFFNRGLYIVVTGTIDFTIVYE